MMKVADIPVKQVLKVPSHIPISECIDMMNQRRVGSILIVDDAVLSGIFTERDVLRMLPRESERNLTRPVSDFMTRNPVTIASNAGLQEAEMLMKVGNFRHLPVVDGGQLVNVISSKDIFEVLYAQEKISSFQLGIVQAIIATVCHEINNPLMIVHGRLGVLRTIENTGQIKVLESSLGRVSEVVKRLSTLEDIVLKNYSDETKIIDLNRAIAELASYIKAA